jgi:hypothetical protein
VSAVTPDGLLFEGEPYSILRRSTSASFFEPGDFGIETEMLHTGAYRGFVCTYAVEDNSLLLHTLEIRSRDRRYPYIYETRPSFPDYLDDTDPQELEVAPDIPKGTENFEMAYDLSMGTEVRDANGKIAWHSDGYALYQNIDMPVSYTGTLRIGRDHDPKYYTGFIPGWLDWMHRKVCDLKFTDGHLESTTDLSDEMAKIREKQQTAEQYFASQAARVSLPK